MKRILVIDDDISILEGIGMLLEDEGYDTVLLNESNDGLDDIVKDRAPDLIILDVLLSGQDGRVICKKLKNRHDTNHIPIILISAHPDAKATAFEAGADEFMPKPFDIVDILGAVERHL